MGSICHFPDWKSGIGTPWLGRNRDCGCIDLAWCIGIPEYKDRQRIVKGIEKIKEGEFNYKVDENNLHGDNLVLAQAVNSIGEGIRTAVETSMKDERLKADLITNVSHDIKTPLTSIINYVDLIKRENIENEKVRGYVDVGFQVTTFETIDR